MSKESINQLWDKFYDYFPEIELPVTLSEEYSNIFTKYNKPLPIDLIDTFILESKMFFAEDAEVDPMSEIEEFVPCFRLPQNKKFHAVVYWKASLLKYEYFLHTFDLNGKSIARQVIASTTADGKKIRQIVATLDPDLEIYVMGGDSDNENFYDPENSKAFSLEITPLGQFIHHFEEN